MRRSCDTRATTASRRGDRGAALVLAIGAAVTLAALASGTVRQGRDTVAVATIALESAQARAAAEAGVATALAALTRGVPAPGAPAAAPGDAPQRTRFEGFDVTMRVSLERGRVDLNRAPPAMLALAARAAGAAAPQAFAAAVVARRSAAAGLSWRVAPKAFDSVAAARPLAEPAAWDALAALLTVHGDAAPDALAAPPALARALLAPPGAARPGPGDVVRVVAMARRPGRAGATVGALAQVGVGRWRVLDWRRDGAWGAGVAMSGFGDVLPARFPR